jgi:hypothetical protein
MMYYASSLSRPMVAKPPYDREVSPARQPETEPKLARLGTGAGTEKRHDTFVHYFAEDWISSASARREATELLRIMEEAEYADDYTVDLVGCLIDRCENRRQEAGRKREEED